MTSNITDSHKRFKFTALASMLIIFTTVFAACGGNSGGSASNTHTLNIGGSVGANYTQNYSPYSINGANPGILGMVYETLFFVNSYDVAAAPKPVLGSTFSWSSDYKTLTVTTQQGVKWSDGQPFTANDVAFTFNMLKQYPKADTNGLWAASAGVAAPLSSVTASDPNTVVFSFNTAQPLLQWQILGKTFIVAQHVFQGQDPTTYNTAAPVGTGPFMLDKFDPTVITYKRNPDFRAASSLQVDELRYPTVKDNNTLQLELQNGEIDWGSFFAPNLNTTFVQLDPAHNHYWMAPAAISALYLNLTYPEFQDVRVRKAIAEALDRTQMSQSAESGYEAPASPTGLVLPNNSAWLDPSLNNPSFSVNYSDANSILDAAGYKKGSDGIRVTPAGKKMSYKIIVPAGWTDWDQICSIISQDLQNIGIQVTVNQETWGGNYNADRGSHNFDMLMGGSLVGPNSGYMLYAMLDSKGAFNWEGWNNAATDAALNDFNSTADPNQQKADIIKVEDIMVNNMPVIPLLNAADWFEYSTKNFTGFPDQNNAYASGATYNSPDNEQVVLNLKPTN